MLRVQRNDMISLIFDNKKYSETFCMIGKHKEGK